MRKSKKTSQAKAKKKSASSKKSSKKIRYAVVGLGHIAQAAVLPAFGGARRNSELVALVTGDQEKEKLAKRYGADFVLGYHEYESFLQQGLVDVAYISLPNDMHREYVEMTAKAGVHVLCEKPLAVTSQDARAMHEAAKKNNVHLMTAYRLHFEKANLEAARIVNSQKMGDIKFFSSVFSMNVKPGNIRTKEVRGGGTLHDIGIYCINAARSLFKDQPLEVMATSLYDIKDPRFKETDEMTSAILRFSDNRLASFTTCFSSAARARYEVICTKGSISLENAYEYADRMTLEVKDIGNKTKSKREYAKRDQFAAELVYFSDCILKNKAPETDAEEGILDLLVIEALLKSAATGKAVKVQPLSSNKKTFPTLRQQIRRKPHGMPDMVNAKGPTAN